MKRQNQHRSAVKTVLRVALWAGIAVIVLIVAAVVVVHLVDWRRSISAAVQEQTGRRLEIGGPVKLRIFPARVLIDDVTFANAPGGSSDVMVKVKRVGARFKLTDLIRGKLALSIDLNEPDVLLETVASGEKNWSLSFEVPVQLAFAQLNVTDGQVVFREHPSGNAWRLEVAKLMIRERLTGGYAGRLEAHLNDIPVKLDGAVRPAEEIAGKKETLSIDGQADISGAKLKFEGLASKDTEGSIVKGNIRADIKDLQVLGKLFQASLPDLPPVTIAANIAASGRLISVDDFNAVLGKSSFTGNITADFEAKQPKINGTVSAKLIDIAELTGSEKKAVKKAKVSGAEGRLIPTQSITIPPLDMADINLNISIEKLLAAQNLTIQNLQTNVVLAGGRLALKPLKMNIAGTDINFEGDADGLGRANVKFSANLNASGIDLGELLKSVYGKEELKGGRTEVVANLQASGRSPAKLASTLKGHVRVSVGPGQVYNRNLDDLLGDVFAGVINTIDPFYVKENNSELKCLVINVPVKDGIVLIDDTVALETNKVGVSLAGFVNLNTEKIDLLARPMAKKGLGIGADLLSDIVRIRGTLANPQTEIDPAGVAKTTILRGIDVATFGLTALFRGQTSKLSADQMCAEALRTETTTSTGKDQNK
jgi:AsmA family protein